MSEDAENSSSASSSSSSAAWVCENCGEVGGGGNYCEACGWRHHSEPAPGPDPPVEQPGSPARMWVAVVRADREFFEFTKAAERGFAFPLVAERRVTLAGEVIRIGRGSRRQHTAPDIDLSVEPTDPGVSRDHARLLRQPNDTWLLVDSGSANGTYVNESRDPIPRNQLIAIADGDRIRLGLWTLFLPRVVPWRSNS